MVGTGSQGAPGPSDILQLSQGVSQAYDGFDPAIHQSKDGQPVMRAGGGYAMKRGRRPGTTNSGPAAPKVDATGQPVPQGPKITNEMAAKMIVGQTVGLCIGIFGEEWDVDTEQEAKVLVSGVKSYLDATGGLQLSPAWGLLFVGGGYALPRVQKPETKSRLKKFASWVFGLFGRKRGE